MEFELTGSVPPKKNLLFKGRGGNFYRPKNVDDFEKSSVFDLISQRNKFSTSFPVYPQKVFIEFFQKRAKDIDNMLGAVFDVLQKAGIIKNDSDIFHLEAIKHIAEPERVIIRLFFET